MNIVFLDIDGVLNGYNFWNMIGWKLVCLTRSKRIKDWYRSTSDPFGVHERKVKRLAKIVHRTDAKIVMSSSWRYRIWNTPYEKLYNDEKKLVDLLKKYHIELIGITPRSSDGRRDKEILEWLSQHENEVDRFVILDDERFDLECFAGKELVQTSSVPKGALIKGHWRENTGLKMRHVRKAIRILRTENK